MIKNTTKLAIISFILILSFVPFFFISAQSIREFIQNFGIFANLAFLLCFAILPIFFFPVFVLAVVSGAFFGLFLGSVYTIIGAIINCALMFYIAKFLGKDIKYPNFLKKLQHLSNKNLFISFFALRLLPIIPYNALNYAPVICKISFKSYILSSFLGFLPWTPIYVNIGANSGNTKGLFISICIAVIATLLSMLGVKKFKIIFNKKDFK